LTIAIIKIEITCRIKLAQVNFAIKRGPERWRMVLKLDASHQQAKENLQRAEKVLEKLKQLKAKQGS